MRYRKAFVSAARTGSQNDWTGAISTCGWNGCWRKVQCRQLPPMKFRNAAGEFRWRPGLKKIDLGSGRLPGVYGPIILPVSDSADQQIAIGPFRNRGHIPLCAAWFRPGKPASVITRITVRPCLGKFHPYQHPTEIRPHDHRAAALRPPRLKASQQWRKQDCVSQRAGMNQGNSHGLILPQWHVYARLGQQTAERIYPTAQIGKVGSASSTGRPRNIAGKNVPKLSCPPPSVGGRKQVNRNRRR